METSCATRGKFGTAIGRGAQKKNHSLVRGGAFCEAGERTMSSQATIHHTINLPACLPASLQSTILYNYLPFKKVGNGNRKVLFFIAHSAGIYICVVEVQSICGPENHLKSKKIWRVTLEQKELSVEGEISITCLNQECCCKALSIYHLMLQGKNIHSCKYTLTNAIFYGFKQKREFCVCNDEASFSNFFILCSLQAEHGNFGLTSFLW